jgi:hypothetical protein
MEFFIMAILKSEFQRVSVALLLGVFCAGFTHAANASSTYDASAGIVVTLTDVTDLDNNSVSSGWSVMLEGFLEPSTSMSSSGDGIANASATSNVAYGSFVFLSIGDSSIQTALSDGTASNGTAASDATSGVYFQNIGNFSGQTLKFNFDYDITATAMASGDNALASATVSLFGFGVDISAIANANSILGPTSDDQSTSGSFFFELTDGGFAQMNASLNSSGSAASVVPVPAAAWLFGSGLLGLLGIARRR